MTNRSLSELEVPMKLCIVRSCFDVVFVEFVEKCSRDKSHVIIRFANRLQERDTGSSFHTNHSRCPYYFVLRYEAEEAAFGAALWNGVLHCEEHGRFARLLEVLTTRIPFYFLFKT